MINKFKETLLEPRFFSIGTRIEENSLSIRADELKIKLLQNNLYDLQAITFYISAVKISIE